MKGGHASNRLPPPPAPQHTHLSGALRVLQVAENQLETLPHNMGQLDNLQVLNLEANKLKTFPTSARRFVNLFVLSISNNYLPTLGSIMDIPFLVQLWASKNQLLTIPNNIGRMKRLQVLLLDVVWGSSCRCRSCGMLMGSGQWCRCADGLAPLGHKIMQSGHKDEAENGAPPVSPSQHFIRMFSSLWSIPLRSLLGWLGPSVRFCSSLVLLRGKPSVKDFCAKPQIVFFLCECKMIVAPVLNKGE